jgi:sugar O-acyltransferase (sialic acid O-acetyltransferase NeuD family)
MEKILIVGTGGLAREFSSWCSDYFQIVGYWSENATEHAEFNLPGILHTGDVTPDAAGTDIVFLAIGAPSVKAKFYKQFSNLGFKFPSFIHPSSNVSDNANIGDGVIISPNCVVSPKVTLNRLVYVNFSCGIGHDAVVGNYVQINPGSQLGGFSKIGDSVLIGSGSIILQGITVGNEATVGSGSVVLSKVAAGATVLGNPAKRMRAFETCCEKKD